MCYWIFMKLLYFEMVTLILMSLKNSSKHSPLWSTDSMLKELFKPLVLMSLFPYTEQPSYLSLALKLQADKIFEWEAV